MLLIENCDFDRLKAVPGPTWRRVFDLRRTLNLPALSGIFRYQELIAPVVPLDRVLYLGEGHIPIVRAKELDIVSDDDYAVLDATAHHLKFIGFQQMYFNNSFPPGFGATPRPELVNAPQDVRTAGVSQFPALSRPLTGEAFQAFVKATAEEVACRLGLEQR